MTPQEFIDAIIAVLLVGNAICITGVLLWLYLACRKATRRTSIILGREDIETIFSRRKEATR